MPTIVGNVENVAGVNATGTLKVAALTVRQNATGDAVVVEQPQTINIVNGVITGSPTIDPGPARVALDSGGRHRYWDVVVPEGASVSLWDLIEQQVEYTPPVVSTVFQYKQDAEAAAVSAESSALTAQAAADSVQGVAEDAAAAESNRIAAETAATNAATSESNAASSASTASTAVASIGTSVEDAQTAASTASGHATAAGTARTAAETARDAAAASATAAGTSEANAATSASAAAQSAQEASDVVASGVPNASDTTKGGIILAGDLAGTYDTPTVPGLAGKLDAPTGGSEGQVLSRAATGTEWVDPDTTGYDVNLLQGAAAGDPVVYRTAEIQAAFNARKARIGPGIWYVNGPITIPVTGCDVTLDGATIVTNITGAYPFSQEGTCLDTGRSARAITAGATQDSTVITTDTAGVVVGDWLLIRSDDAQENDATALAGMLRQVKAVSGSTVTVDLPLYRSLPTNPRCVRVRLADPMLIGGAGVFKHSNPAGITRSMIRANLAVSPTLGSGITVGPHGGPAFQVSNTVNAVSSATFIDLMNDTTTGHYGYGVNDGGCSRNTRILGGVARRVRHGYTTNNTSEQIHPDFPTTKYGEPEDFYVGGGFLVVDSTDAGLDTHEPGRRGTIEVRAINCAIGAQDRSTDCTFIVHQIVAPTLHGIHIAATSRRSTWVNLNVTNPVPSAVSGQANPVFVRGRASARLITPAVADMSSGWLASNLEAGVELTLVGGGQLSGTRTGAGKVLVASLDGASRIDPAAQTDLREALAAFGLVPATGALGLSIGTGVITSGTVTSTGSIQGRTLRAVGTNAADVLVRFDGVSGQTADVFQTRVNGVSKFSINPNGKITSASAGNLTYSRATAETSPTLAGVGAAIAQIRAALASFGVVTDNTVA